MACWGTARHRVAWPGSDGLGMAWQAWHMTGRIVLYSAIYGRSYDSPKDVRGAAGAHRVLLTDQPIEAAALEAGWDEVRQAPLAWLKTPMLRAKWWKTHPELATYDAETTLWIDGSLTPYDGYVERCMGALDGVDMALTPHPWRTCIYTELAASLTLPKYDDEAMKAQCAAYFRAGHPLNWGLFATGAIARRNTPDVCALGSYWWQENRDRSHQDQLSLPVVLRDSSEIPWAANMPWDQWWGYTDHGVFSELDTQ